MYLLSFDQDAVYKLRYFQNKLFVLSNSLLHWLLIITGLAHEITSKKFFIYDTVTNSSNHLLVLGSDLPVKIILERFSSYIQGLYLLFQF